jgi:putative FmdB family regulatory protein
MPTYEYQCPDGHVFEKFQKMSDKPRAKCPVCGKPATRKISGGAGLVFKGTGFYITDYGKDGKGPRKEGAEKHVPSGREGAEKTERTERTERTEKTERTERAEAKQPSGDTSKKADASPAKSAPGSSKGKAAPE